MNTFLENLKREAEAAKLIDAMGHAKGSAAYAKDVERRVKRDRK